MLPAIVFGAAVFCGIMCIWNILGVIAQKLDQGDE